MKSRLHILHLEDNPGDAELIQDILETDGIVAHVTRVETQADFLTSLEQGRFDLILADYSLPSFDGLSALKLALEKCPNIPFIFVSATLGEEVAIEALKLGATDYVLKDRLSRIAPAVQRALREAEERNQRKRVESEIWRLQLEMGRVERLAALGKMTGAIAHELGTPLNSVLGYTQLLAGEDLPEAARRRVAVIETQIHRMIDIIQHYLSQSRGAAPKMRIHVNDLIRETLVLLQPILQQHGIKITTALAESPPPLFGDRVSLQRVLTNLIDNAVDATGGKGRINVKTVESPGAAGEAPGVIIEITDDGAGIPPEILPKIFDLFVTTKAAGKGTGLGLAISQEIIKAHGGNINVSSEVGQGTTVQIFLPIDADARESVMEKRA